jgi:hypothetical protein
MPSWFFLPVLQIFHFLRGEQGDLFHHLSFVEVSVLIVEGIHGTKFGVSIFADEGILGSHITNEQIVRMEFMCSEAEGVY